MANHTPFLALKGGDINPNHVEAIMMTAISKVAVISLFVWKEGGGTSRKDILFEIGNEWSYCGKYQISRFCEAGQIIKRGEIGSWYRDYKTSSPLFKIHAHHSKQESDRTEMTVWGRFKKDFPRVGKAVEYIIDATGVMGYIIIGVAIVVLSVIWFIVILTGIINIVLEIF